MIESLIFFLNNTLLPFGPIGVFGASLIEEIIAPIPSALVMLGSGFLFLPQGFELSSIWKLISHVALPISLGVALGSLVVYSIARFAGLPLLYKYGYVLGINKEDLIKAENYFSESKKDELIIFTARVIPIVPASVIAVSAGLIKMPVYRYLLISILGTFIRAFILGAIGAEVGALYLKYAEEINKWEHLILIILLISILILVIYLLIRKHKKQYGRSNNI